MDVKTLEGRTLRIHQTPEGGIMVVVYSKGYPMPEVAKPIAVMGATITKEQFREMASQILR